MTTEALADLAPLAALGALDGADKVAFEAESARSEALRGELAVFERLVGQIGLGGEWIDPRVEARERVLAVARTAAVAAPSAAGAAASSAAPSVSAPSVGTPTGHRASVQPSVAEPLTAPVATRQPRAFGWGTWLPLAAAVVVALAGLTWRGQRDQARREVERARAEADTLVAQNRDLQAQLEATQRRLAVSEAFRSLVGRPTTHVVSLAGLPAAPAARGRVIWNPDQREAVLLATGLPTPPAGKAYEAWVIAGGAPVPAGVFRVDESGRAVHPLPRLEDTARAKTFAVTLEPEAGTTAPSGPMVLAGPAI
jgi:hypothetical protein